MLDSAAMSIKNKLKTLKITVMSNEGIEYALGFTVKDWDDIHKALRCLEMSTTNLINDVINQTKNEGPE